VVGIIHRREVSDTNKGGMLLLEDLRLDVDGCDVGEGKAFCVGGVVAVLSQDADFGPWYDQLPTASTASDYRHHRTCSWRCTNER
jgi:hypothetical protein